MRKRKYIIHFSKPGSKRGLPWTIHGMGRCIPAKEVSVDTLSQTVYKPEKKTNPRAWIMAYGFLHEKEPFCYVICDYPPAEPPAKAASAQ